MGDRKSAAKQIFRDTLAGIDIPATLARKLNRQGSVIQAGGKSLDLRHGIREIVAISMGKAAFALAEGLTAVLAPKFRVHGILAGPTSPPRSLDGWKIFVSGHPVPNEESFRAGRAILELLRDCDSETLIFFLLSGGGSSLVELPLDQNISLDDFVKMHHALVTCGAPIEDINVIRKHVSAVKGGRLAAAAPRAMKLTLGVTDVPEGQETALASGPTLPDPSTAADAERIARKYNLLEAIPASLRAKFERGDLQETPKAGDAIFSRANFELLLGRRDLFHHAHVAAEAAGFFTVCDNSTDGWPVEKAAQHLLAQLDSIARSRTGRPIALIADGEVSSPVTGKGTGGRNSAFVLACVEKIASREITVLSVGTDGIDGNSPAAGAVADGTTAERARTAKMEPQDFYRRSDAFSFFDNLGDTVMTGPTGNNLRDLRILLAG
ncbi:MAG: glycerate kinase type-2 family protein [Candidatus Acidiferrales bacterium]